MIAFAHIRWLRILIGGFLAELAVFAFVIPISIHFGQHSLIYTAPPASMVACFFLAMWVGRRIDSQFILHGFLVGVVATLIYVALTRANPEPAAYLLAHGLKMLGGAAGGFVAGLRHKAVHDKATSSATSIQR